VGKVSKAIYKKKIKEQKLGGGLGENKVPQKKTQRSGGGKNTGKGAGRK
jgi:hypothetical protein